MTTHFLNLWKEARSRFQQQMQKISEEDLKKTLGKSPNSLGFLIRHIAEVEQLFAKNVFQLNAVKITAKTIIEREDTGKWINLQELKEIHEQAFEKLQQAIKQQSNEDWKKEVTTKEFGTKTLSEAFGRVVSHTAYHAGQMAIINTYEKIN
ncbi:MAG: DinB family protein [Flavobacteriaceae bacterium]|nr:DinB family protein [Flavobacteriaceae bacterium]